MQHGMGQSSIDTAVSAMTKRAMDAMMPHIKQAIAEGAKAAEPTIRKVVVEDVLPKFGLAVVLGIAAGAAISAAIGSHFATRRNPPRRYRSQRLRRRAA